MRTACSLTVSHCMPPGNHECPPGNHTPPATMHIPLQPHMPPQQPHMPPATMHAPRNHACSPATTHAPLATMHAPRQPRMPPSNHTCPPVNRMTDRCKNITLPQTSFAGDKNPASFLSRDDATLEGTWLENVSISRRITVRFRLYTIWLIIV